MTRPTKPKGAKTRAPVVPITTARRAFKNIKARAEQGSPEDERAILDLFARQIARPFDFSSFHAKPAEPTGPGLLGLFPNTETENVTEETQH